MKISRPSGFGNLPTCRGLPLRPFTTAVVLSNMCILCCVISNNNVEFPGTRSSCYDFHFLRCNRNHVPLDAEERSSCLVSRIPNESSWSTMAVIVSTLDHNGNWHKHLRFRDDFHARLIRFRFLDHNHFTQKRCCVHECRSRTLQIQYLGSLGNSTSTGIHFPLDSTLISRGRVS
jgi:hypothetical protein